MIATRLLSFFVLFLGSVTRGDDAFYRIRFSEITFTEGTPPQPDQTSMRRWTMQDILYPYAVLDGEGEIYALTEDSLIADAGGGSGRGDVTPDLFIRSTEGKSLTGVLVLPNADWTGMVPLRFSVKVGDAKPEASGDFYRAKTAHYLQLQDRNLPGSAWFRHRGTEAYRVLLKDNPDLPAPRPARMNADLSSTYDLFVGGRAISENLQLSRGLPPAPGAPANPEPDDIPVPVSLIEGVTVRSIDWTPLLPATPPTLDALAGFIPADQHAVFFPSFDALMALSNETTEAGLPIFRGVGQRSEDGRIVERYQRQLCLQPGVIARLFGPSIVSSVAVTGSDPYFPLGTDVAVLFHSGNASALRELIAAQVAMRAGSDLRAAAAATSGEVGGIAYSGMVSPDRAVCSYVCVIADAVVVTNSLVQIKNLAAVHAGTSPAVSTLPEYIFFRNRYPLSDAAQTGLVFISDAAIRRWCSAEWRIGASRRVRAAAILADVNASNMDDLVAGTTQPRSVESLTRMRTIGQLTISPGGVRSSVYGTPTFMTPIAELGITDVGPDEAASYNRWRDFYQRNWSWAFDPIAIAFSLQESSVSADLTVMPLIVGSRYRTWIEAAQGVLIEPGAGDRHDAIAHGILAINAEAMALKNAAGMAQMFSPGVAIDPLGWLGKSVAIYADADPFWAEMLSADGEEPQFFEQNLARIPIAIHAEVGSALKLTAFVAAARGALEQAAPGMTSWTTLTHNGQPYVRVGLSEKAKAESQGGDFDNGAVFYAATPRALILSPNEDVLKRSIDRLVSRIAPAAAATATEPWLGSSMCMQVSRQGLELLGGPGGGLMRDAAQRSAWSNIPILNEWKRRYPDKDPIQVHAARWGIYLACPGGGTYVWNERFRTMESTAYGHPGDPKVGPEGMGPLDLVRSGNFGLTFEEHGLRAKAVVERSGKPTR